MRAVVITVSDSASAGTAADRSGPLAVSLLTDQGFAVDSPVVVADDIEAIQAAIIGAGDAELVVTTGGTGLAPRDVTPAATRGLLDREAPGLADLVRRAAAGAVPTAALSCGVAGVRGSSLVVNLPGSTGGVRDGLAALAPVLEHAVAQVRGVATGHAGGRS